ncbi:helix-turn-helix transcriptional regulator [uncultured Enterococcus sp.]|uniref:helix-turn-helix domain-containing protein n=1 Tax=uncultured Enterococcus sp. TaxID=167972 RepID=UPI002AA950D2|nr:helix-turn-helix transcriptional regulator [uncultured Enterococcus sp.]
MTTFERVKKLADSQKISIVELEERLGFGKNSLYRWKTSAPASDKLQKVADFFNVSTDYLLGRELKEQKTSELSDDALIMTLDGKEVSAADREIIIAAARAVIAQREANNKNDN